MGGEPKDAKETEKMKIYILYPRFGETGFDWPRYESVYKLVVIASSAKEARKVASQKAGLGAHATGRAFADPKHTICQQLLPNGPDRVVCVERCEG